MKKIIVIGAGVSGLSAAYAVRQAADAGNDVDVLVLEADDRTGGKLVSEVIEHETGRYVVDGGSDSYLVSKPAIGRVARAVGVGGEMVQSREENKKTYIVKKGKLVALPDGIMMFAPTKLLPLATTNLYSWPAKFRMAMDLFMPRREVWKEGETAQDHDESLESFVVRRMGRECLDTLAEPLVGGVHASDPAKMSLAATFPNLLDMEQEWGSLVRGFMNQRKKVEQYKKEHPLKPGEKANSFFGTFREGMGTFAERLADAVGRDHIRTGVSVSTIEPAEGGWRVRTADGEELDADAVIVATEGWAATKLTEQVDARISELLGTIPYSSSATCTMAFTRDKAPKDLKWFGILSPIVENRPLLAITMASSKWPDRCPEDMALFRGFVGGPRNQEVMKKSDVELIETIRRQIVELLGMDPEAQPVFARLYRWNLGMPQYTLGHLDRVDEIESRSAGIKGFGLAGGAFRGVGVPNCIESGERAASKVLGELGIPHAERIEAAAS